MAFSSFSAYLDHPNFHQLQQSGLHQGGAGDGGGGLLENPELPNGLTTQPPSLVGGGLGSIRPGSMVDRARQAKVPVPEAGLKCPRCESTHTKFCYFNNYSLTQPRHFCKTCRRYWTRGGALRNVPVGGGCRRNKRSKGANNNGSKPSSSAGAGAPSLEKAKPAAADGGNSGGGSTSPCVSPTDIGGGGHYPQLTPPPHVTAAHTFQNANHFEGSNNGFHLSPLVVTSGGGGGGMGELGFQFPYLGGYHELLGCSSHSNIYPNFHMMSEASAPKMEEMRQGLNSTKHFLGTLENNNNNHYWGWTSCGVGFSGINASSPTTHDLL
ncbi:unnamed protein product [Cuscuta campestris]|uniref:Dof zinc finger protein n=1 Tax=Cuscuta campestris TaxID=132261 RepID=A0A484NEB7_9ASTE|nr:unnamed protein product [Cuscuta campestris]